MGDVVLETRQVTGTGRVSTVLGEVQREIVLETTQLAAYPGAVSTKNTGSAAPVPAPVNTVAPAITGTPQVGQVVTLSNGTWSNSPTGYAYQWLLDGTPISGATSSTYTLVTGQETKTVTGRVTATNAGGSTSVTSAGVTVQAASPVMPAGATAIWYADQYNTAARAIPNAVVGGTPPPNLFRGSRRLFANSQLWKGVNATATDGVSGDLSRLLGTGNWYFGVEANAATLPAGTYTAAFSGRRNTGSDQIVAISPDNTSTRATKTLTSTVQRLSHTFTKGSAFDPRTILLCSSDGSTGADILIQDFELFAGSVDLGGNEPVGHLYLGDTTADTRPAYAAGEIDLSNSGRGLVQFSAPVSFASFTTVALTKKVSAGSTYQAFLSKLQDYQAFTSYMELGEKAYFSTNNVGEADQPGLWRRQGQGYHAITHRYDNATGTHTIWLDDMKLFSAVSAQGPITLADLTAFWVADKSLTTGDKFSGGGFFGSALTDQQVRDAVAAFQARAVAQSLTATSHARLLITEGDSISGGFAYSFPTKFGPNASPAVLGNNIAVSGSTIANLNSRAAQVDAALPPAGNRAGRKFILSVLIGANDLKDAASATAYANDLAAYCDARRAAGWLVAVCTILPRQASADPHNARRATVNTTIRGWVGSHCDAVVDFAADATMGPDSAANNTSLYGDGLHPTDLGQVNLEAIYRPVINGL